MANTLVFFGQNVKLIMGTTNFIIRQSNISFLKTFGVRNLYSPVTLGIDGYLQQKERTKAQLANISGRFREKMQEYTAGDSKNMVFTEDLKNMLHLADGDDDVKLIIKMMKRFNQQNQQMRFGSFVFGPVVMRMLHFLNKPQEAIECFKDKDLDGMFDQVMTYQILLDLLYENQKYNDILDAFEIIRNKQIEGIKYAKNVIVLIFATLYKLNTPESFKYALDLWKELHNVGHLPMRRAITFCAGLALNQGKPEATLEIISNTRNVNYTTIRNLKVAALLELGRFEEVIIALKSIILEDSATVGPVQTFNSDVIDKVKIAVEKLGNNDISLEFKRVLKYFQEQGHISELTLDTQLCQEIATPPTIGKRTNENYNRQHYQSNQFNRNVGNRMSYDDRSIGGRRLRPGLSDL